MTARNTFSLATMAIVFVFIADAEGRPRESRIDDDDDNSVPTGCIGVYDPSSCPVKNISLDALETVEDFDKCAPALLPPKTRFYYLAAAGRRITYNDNLNSYKRIPIIPRILRDVSGTVTSTTVLGERITVPIGLSPTAAMRLAHPEGEAAAARAAVKEGTVMIVSSFATMSLEDIAEAAAEAAASCSEDGLVCTPILWMQTYIFEDEQVTLRIIRRAEKAGFKAIVVTVDSPVEGAGPCGKKRFPGAQHTPNINTNNTKFVKISSTFEDLMWVTMNTNLPVVAKGVLNGPDALQAVKAGASAILVSNHGGRQLDSSPASINALPEVVAALKDCCPWIEIYLDGGIRNGFDVYKALARGARAVFFGRPTLWGLTVGGEEGVRKVLTIMRKELNNTMILAGSPRPQSIRKNANYVKIF